MRKLDAQRISIPNLTPAELWKESGKASYFYKNTNF